MTASEPVVTSRWWYVVAATTVYGLVALAAVLLILPLLRFAARGAAGGEPGLALGLSAVGVLALVIPLLLLGFLLSLLFPVAIYADADAVSKADVGWDPDPFLYGLVGLVGLFAGGTPIQPAVGLYYLYRRHQHVGTP